MLANENDDLGLVGEFGDHCILESDLLQFNDHEVMGFDKILDFLMSCFEPLLVDCYLF